MGGPSAISILFPIVAMGLPISDTAMAIFRRWVRNLPLSAADRRHVHHLLMGLGLNPRRAALMLYCFSAFLCGVVMLGVAGQNEYLTLILGIFGCLAFLLVVTSRRDELSNLRDDLQDRLARGRQERTAAKLTWEAIQRIELCADRRRRRPDPRSHSAGDGLAAAGIGSAAAGRTGAARGRRRRGRAGVGTVRDLSTLRWPRALDHDGAGPGRGDAPGGGHRVPLHAAAGPGPGRAHRSGLEEAPNADRFGGAAAVQSSRTALICHIVTEATMDAIQTYRGYPAAPSPLRPAPAALAVNPAAVKTTSNYLRA